MALATSNAVIRAAARRSPRSRHIRHEERIPHDGAGISGCLDKEILHAVVRKAQFQVEDPLIFLQHVVVGENPTIQFPAHVAPL